MSAPLMQEIKRRIETAGPIGLADYMELALGHPAHGYYATRDPLGAKGDFVTAPEISQMFGELLGLWCAEAWRRAGAPGKVRLVELGPGRGTLMADALRALRLAPDFRAAATVHLVEASPALRAVQRATLAGHDVAWHGDLGEVPDGPLLLIANEFLDALPIRQIVRAEDGWHERLVGLDGAGGFAFTLDPRPTGLAALLPGALRECAPEGSLVELSPAVLGVAAAIARRVAADGIAALIVDYGHAATGPGETLQAVRGHRRHAVLEAPGTADLTAHVDFAALGLAAVPPASTLGPVGQGDFLRRLGIEHRARTLAAAGNRADEVAAALRRLTDPAEMGTLFKVLALVPPGAPSPAGFEGVAP